MGGQFPSVAFSEVCGFKNKNKISQCHQQKHKVHANPLLILDPDVSLASWVLTVGQYETRRLAFVNTHKKTGEPRVGKGKRRKALQPDESFKDRHPERAHLPQAGGQVLQELPALPLLVLSSTQASPLARPALYPLCLRRKDPRVSLFGPAAVCVMRRRLEALDHMK